MYVGQDWDDLDPAETREVLSIEFTRDIQTGETISSAVVVASIAATKGVTADPAPQSRVIGAAVPSSVVDPISGKTRLYVSFPVGAALVGNKYLFNVVATLSSGRTPARYSHAWCRSPA